MFFSEGCANTFVENNNAEKAKTKLFFNFEVSILKSLFVVCGGYYGRLLTMVTKIVENFYFFEFYHSKACSFNCQDCCKVFIINRLTKGLRDC